MSPAPAPAAPCPDETIIAAFAQGELSPAQAEGLEAHLDACEACSLVVAELARIFESDAVPVPQSMPEPAPFADAPLGSEELAETLGADDDDAGPRPLGSLLRAGAEVGRYRVLDCVGVGGMGVVYAAYDPELDRRVALKLLRGARDDAGSQGRNARLLREAQALAKLAHPNVITVHDVGTWEGQVFVAMEYVDGPTLKGWLATRRSWPEIREVFVAAGRGLEAAHAVGLVHRDFKPDNVLIGKDGRVRVTDFGLARWGQATRSAEDVTVGDEWSSSSHPIVVGPPGSGARSHDPAVSLTATGALVGTPAYMAPEQYLHRPADVASDQFAFCVALYEAIHGTRPFPGRTVAELASNVMEGRQADAPADKAVPRAVRQALRRGLSRERSDRFPTMGALLAVLDHRPSRRWRSWAAAGVALLGLGAGGLWAYAQDHATRSAFCRVERGLADVWGPARREGIREAFLATELSYAAETAERALPAVDEYVASWEQMRARSCDPQAIALEGPGGAALRERCLDRRRVALDALLEGFAAATPQTVGRAVGSVAALPDVERCGDPEALVAELPPAPPPELRDAVEDVRDRLWRGEGLIAGGRYGEGLELARRVDAEATALGHRPLQAEARRLLARLLDYSGQAEAANEALEQAGLLAASSRHRRELAKVLVDQVYVLGMTLPHMAEAEKVALRAQAELEGAGMEEEILPALLLNRGSVAFRRGDYDAADELFRQALARRDREREPLRWADAAFNLATLELVRGHERQAIIQLQSYLEVFEGALGSMHPEVATGYQNLGSAYFNAGLLAEAREALSRAEVILRKTSGIEHPQYASTLNMLGNTTAAQGEEEEGLRYARRAVALLEAHGDDPTRTASNRVDLGDLLVDVGRLDEAERETNAALEVLLESLGPEHPHVAAAHGVLAKVAGFRGNAEAVRQHMDRMSVIHAAAFGEDVPELDEIAAMRARLLAVAGQRDEAIAGLRQRLARPAEPPLGEPELAVRFALAELLWEQPEHRAEARALATEAERGYRSLGLGPVADTVEQWLDEHDEP